MKKGTGPLWVMKEAVWCLCGLGSMSEESLVLGLVNFDTSFASINEESGTMLVFK